MPSLLSEIAGLRRLTVKQLRQKYADAVVKGIVAFLGNQAVAH